MPHEIQISSTACPPLPREFYDRDVVLVARELLGRLLIRRTRGSLVAGRIVETEAYLGAADPAAHSYRGPTPRNQSMFGPPGHAYVYAIHAKHCVNVVCERAGVAHAVLIRAVEPLAGLEQMRRRRRRERELELTRGPARLCQAMAIGPRLDGWDLTWGRQLWIAGAESVPVERQCQGPRVGISRAQELPLRFAIAGCRYVSLPRVRPTSG